MIILKIFLFLILFGIVMLVVRIAPTLWRFRQMYKSWKRMDEDMQQRTTSQQENGDRPTVSDRRDPSRAHRKIIPADEGEYVDFVEEE